MWSILNFGKHKGKSLPEVVLRDPDWFFWAVKNKVLGEQGYGAEGQELDFKARNIKIPRPSTEHWRINYVFDRRGRFSDFTLIQVANATEAHPNRLDLSIGYRQKHYDKLGGKLLIKEFKIHYFGSQKAKLSRPRCEGFFDNEANFFAAESTTILAQPQLTEFLPGDI
jgi:hypothetical protein